MCSNDFKTQKYTIQAQIKANHTCHQQPNLSRETVPLNNNTALTSIETLAASRHYSDLLCSAASCCHKSHLPLNICKQKKRKYRRNYFKFSIAVCVIAQKFSCLYDSLWIRNYLIRIRILRFISLRIRARIRIQPLTQGQLNNFLNYKCKQWGFQKTFKAFSRFLKEMYVIKDELHHFEEKIS